MTTVRGTTADGADEPARGVRELRVVVHGSRACGAHPDREGATDSVPEPSAQDCRTDKHSGWLRHQATGAGGGCFPLT
ncbi:hypothetical protein GCM10020227_55510 [Streptomyces flavovirens]